MEQQQQMIKKLQEERDTMKSLSDTLNIELAQKHEEVNQLRQKLDQAVTELGMGITFVWSLSLC